MERLFYATLLNLRVQFYYIVKMVGLKIREIARYDVSGIFTAFGVGCNVDLDKNEDADSAIEDIVQMRSLSNSCG